MIDRTFTATLVFSLLAFATATIASLMFAAPKSFPRHVQLERVVITAKRMSPATLAHTEPVLPALRSTQ